MNTASADTAGKEDEYDIPTDLLIYNHMKAQQGAPVLPLDHPAIVKGMERIRNIMDAGLSGVSGLGGSLLGGLQTLGAAHAAAPAGDGEHGAGRAGGDRGASGVGDASWSDTKYAVGGEKEGDDTSLSGPPRGTVPLPQHLQWANDPAMLSNWLAAFNARRPLHPGNASPRVREVFGGMRAPAENYAPPAGANKDAATYWFTYEGYPEQYALNKVSNESSGNPHAYANDSNAAGLAQVLPRTALEAGFNFYTQKNMKGEETGLDTHAWKTAMNDPNFAGMLGAMIARKSFNEAKGDPFRAEAGYRNGFGALARKEAAGKPWSNPGYVKKMFPGQWIGQ